jgi:hypothetical protein
MHIYVHFCTAARGLAFLSCSKNVLTGTRFWSRHCCHGTWYTFVDRLSDKNSTELFLSLSYAKTAANWFARGDGTPHSLRKDAISQRMPMLGNWNGDFPPDLNSKKLLASDPSLIRNFWICKEFWSRLRIRGRHCRIDHRWYVSQSFISFTTSYPVTPCRIGIGVTISRCVASKNLRCVLIIPTIHHVYRTVRSFVNCIPTSSVLKLMYF